MRVGESPARLPFDWDRAARELAALDPRLAVAAGALGWPRPPGSWERCLPLFEGLVRAVVAQQLSARAAAAIEARIEQALGTPLHPEALLACGVNGLRGLGLSRAKAEAILGIAQEAAEGRLPDREEAAGHADEALSAALCRLRGVGRWTAEMVLVFTLGRPDVLASADLGLRRGYAHLLGRIEPVAAVELARAGQRWRPWRTLASLMLWRLAAYGPLDQHQCQGS